MRYAAVRREPRELDAGGVGDVQERTERARGEQSLARAPEHPGGHIQGAELAQERGLADPCLAAQEHHSPAAGGRLGERLRKRVEDLRALEQLDPALVRSRLSAQRRHRSPPAAPRVAWRRISLGSDLTDYPPPRGRGCVSFVRRRVTPAPRRRARADCFPSTRESFSWSVTLIAAGPPSRRSFERRLRSAGRLVAPVNRPCALTGL